MSLIVSPSRSLSLDELRRGTQLREDVEAFAEAYAPNVRDRRMTYEDLLDRLEHALDIDLGDSLVCAVYVRVLNIARKIVRECNA